MSSVILAIVMLITTIMTRGFSMVHTLKTEERGFWRDFPNPYEMVWFLCTSLAWVTYCTLTYGELVLVLNLIPFCVEMSCFEGVYYYYTGDSEILNDYITVICLVLPFSLIGIGIFYGAIVFGIAAATFQTLQIGWMATTIRARVSDTDDNFNHTLHSSLSALNAAVWIYYALANKDLLLLVPNSVMPIRGLMEVVALRTFRKKLD